MIKITKIYAPNSEDLEGELNELGGRIISVQPQYDSYYEVIYETDTNNT